MLPPAGRASLLSPAHPQLFFPSGPLFEAQNKTRDRFFFDWKSFFHLPPLARASPTQPNLLFTPASCRAQQQQQLPSDAGTAMFQAATLA